MGVLKEGGGGDEGGAGGWLWALPGAFGQGGAVERRLGVGVSIGEEVREGEAARGCCFCNHCVGFYRCVRT